MRRRGLFLDLDGTLADSLSALKDVYCSFLEEYAAVPSDAEFYRLNGPPLPEIVRRLKKRHKLKPKEDELLAHYVEMAQRGQSNAKPAKGASQLIELAGRNGWSVCVVTSSPSAMAVDWLQRSGLIWGVAAVVGGDDVSAGKPSPEPYRLALARISADAACSLAVEDSLAGAASALGAGLRTCVIAQDRRAWPEGVEFVNELAEVAALL